MFASNLIRPYALSFVILFISAIRLSAQCHGERYLGHCSNKLGDYNLLRAFHLNPEGLKENKVTIKYIFSKNAKYRIVICDSETDQLASMIVNIYDNNRRLYLTSSDEKHETLHSVINFACKATKEYNIDFIYLDRMANNCGVAILGSSIVQR